MKPGGAFATDGEVIEGGSSASEAALTGETCRNQNNRATKVFAATINNERLLRCRATQPAAAMFAAIMRLTRRSGAQNAGAAAGRPDFGGVCASGAGDCAADLAGVVAGAGPV